jgi:hypothetical protein
LTKPRKNGILYTVYKIRLTNYEIPEKLETGAARLPGKEAKWIRLSGVEVRLVSVSFVERR